MEISIVVPVHNRVQIVGRTLDSIRNQDYRPLHLVVVDNNSTDGTLSVLELFKKQNETDDFKVTVAGEPRQGAAIARNTGARLVDGDWLMFFDSDDVMDTDLLSRYANAIKNNADCQMVHVDADWTNGVEHRKVYSPRGNEPYNQILYSHFGTCRYVVKKTLFDAVGGWNEALGVLDDRELGMKLLLRSPRIVYIDGCVPVHIFHQEESITGEQYSSKHDACERALDAIETVIRESGARNEKSLLDILNFKRIHLAGLYSLEGNRTESQRLFRQTVCSMKKQLLLRWLYSFLYWNIVSGRRGAVPIVKLFVRP